MSFDKCVQSYNYHHNHTDIFFSPKKFLRKRKKKLF